jgi:hypothetical protein
MFQQKSFTTINKYKCSSGGVYGVEKLIPKFLEVSPSLAPRKNCFKGGLGDFSN